jgi:hypothetical protein
MGVSRSSRRIIRVSMQLSQAVLMLGPRIGKKKWISRDKRQNKARLGPMCNAINAIRTSKMNEFSNKK